MDMITVWSCIGARVFEQKGDVDWEAQLTVSGQLGSEGTPPFWRVGTIFGS